MKSFTLVVALASLELATAAVGPWLQCGGSPWTGETTCVTGYCCNYSSQWYSQCIPPPCSGGSSVAVTTASRTSSTSSRTTTRVTTTTSRAATTTTTPVRTTTTAANPAATTFCGQWDGLVTSNNYGIYNNLWGMSAATSGSQCTWYNGIVGSGVSWGTSWTWAGGPYNVKSYAVGGKIVEPPRLISSISSLPSTFVWTNTGTNMIANVAYDLFTSANSAAETWAGDYELMIWVGVYGGAGPISATGSPIATVTVAGYSWKVYYGLNGTMKVYSFVAANGNVNNFSADIKLFYNWLSSTQSFPASSQYLLAFQAGTEPFTGSGRLDVSQYTAAVN